ncbi:hypothetical protein HPP92_020630 [Vanilla planifolia]|uniref:Uncharacterized protein n=1 Tax=Vanilla planifolia TaxID=51239 RepID=A0A835UH75_VANPL|nr:hypothetical protein HPP92_021062 [Vanilla planifolia]KAG0462154.1 hypothetical protein HPP92_020630 [Vanilla planifolia]
MAVARILRQPSLRNICSQPFLRPLLASQPMRFASRSLSAQAGHRRYPPPPPHEFSKPCEFLGCWQPPANPREAEARLDRLRKDYTKQVSQLRKEYAYETEILKLEKQRKDEARREAIRQANEERKTAKAAAAETAAAQRKAFQQEFRQTLLKERAEKLECWKKKEELREQKKKEKRELLRQQSSMWVSEENLENRILEAIVDTNRL